MLNKHTFIFLVVLLSELSMSGCVGSAKNDYPLTSATGTLTITTPEKEPLSGYSFDFNPTTYNIPEIPQNLSFVFTNNTDHALNNLIVVQKGDPVIRSVGDIVSFLKKDTDQDTALSIWNFVRQYRYNWDPADPGDLMHNPAMYLLTFGYGFCDDTASAVSFLSRKLNLPSNVIGLDGHVIAESFYDGDWHVLDPDHQFYYYDGLSIASLEALHSNPYLVNNASDSEGLDASYSQAGNIANLYSGPYEDFGTNDFYYREDDRQFGLNLDKGEKIIIRKASAEDGFFSTYDIPIRPPLYYLADIQTNLGMSASTSLPLDRRHVLISTTEQSHVLAGLKINIENLPTDEDNNLSIQIAVPDSKIIYSVSPTITRNGSTLTMSAKYSDLGITFPIYQYTLILTSSRTSLNPYDITLTSSYHVGSLFIPRIQPGQNQFQAIFNSENNLTLNDSSQTIALELANQATNAFSTSLLTSSIATDSNSILADGNHFARIKVKLLDENSNPLENRLVAAISDRPADILYSIVDGNSDTPRGFTNDLGEVDFIVRSLSVGTSHVNFTLPFEDNEPLGQVTIEFQSVL